MNFQGQSIQTVNGEVNIGSNYLYTEYKFSGVMYGIQNASYKFIVKIQAASQTKNHINFTAEIIEVVMSAGGVIGVGDTFGFSINKMTEMMLWDLRNVEERD